MLIGVISDTHGLLRPEAVTALQGVDMILHAGDIGRPEIITELQEIAPVTAVRGNNDKGDWAANIADCEVVDVNGVSIYMLHDVKELDLIPAAAGFSVVIAGHSHKPLIEERNGVLYLNPGSAGPFRFSLPVTIARLNISAGSANAEIVEIVKR